MRFQVRGVGGLGLKDLEFKGLRFRVQTFGLGFLSLRFSDGFSCLDLGVQRF